MTCGIHNTHQHHFSLRKPPSLLSSLFLELWEKPHRSTVALFTAWQKKSSCRTRKSECLPNPAEFRGTRAFQNLSMEVCVLVRDSQPSANHTDILQDRNTTWTHPDADTSYNATIEAPENNLGRTTSRHSSFHLFHHHNKRKESQESFCEQDEGNDSSDRASTNSSRRDSSPSAGKSKKGGFLSVMGR